MEDLDDVMCSVIQEITCFHIETVGQLKDGRYLHLLLEKIDPSFFHFSESDEENWYSTEQHLMHYLQQKHIDEDTIDFDLEQIVLGNKGMICHALLQIFAVLVVFNKSYWEEVMKKVGFLVHTQIKNSLDSMIKQLTDLVNESKAKNVFGGDANLRSMLQTLESKQEIIENQNTEIENLKNELETAKLNIQIYQTQLKDKEKELEGVTALKDNILKDIMKKEDKKMRGMYEDGPNKNSELQFLEKEVLLQRSLLHSKETALLDKTMEIEKLTTLLQNLDKIKSENEELSSELEHFKKLAEDTKKHNQLLDQRFQAMGSFQNFVEELKNELLNEKKMNTKIAYELEDKSSLIDTLQKKLDILEGNRKTGGRNPLDGRVNDLYSMELFKTVEVENKKYKKQLEELSHKNQLIQSKLNLYTMEDKENQALKAQIASFLSEENNRINQSQENFKKSSLDKLANEQKDSQKELGKKSSLDRFATEELDEQQNGEDKARKEKETFAQDFGMVYSAIMEFYKNEIAESRRFVYNRSDRDRNIFKQFMLTGMLMEEDGTSS